LESSELPPPTSKRQQPDGAEHQGRRRRFGNGGDGDVVEEDLGEAIGVMVMRPNFTA